MTNRHIENLFIELLRYSLDDSCPIQESVISINCQKLFQWAQQQAIVGIVFNGIERAGNTISIPREDLLQWIGYIQQIEQQNRLINKRCVELCESFGEQGMRCCILKGQGNAMMYPYPLRRASGDIDVWGQGKSITEIIQFAHKNNPKGKACYHHVDYGMFKDVEVEVHYRPSFMFNPLHNYRLQKWFCKMANEGCMKAELPDDVGSICVPNKDFNIIFQLSHVYNHLLHEGIGLRQIVDYYYLLKSNTNCTNETDYQHILRYLGLEKIAGAMMWVIGFIVYGERLMVDSTGDRSWMICEPDERRGRVLLAEIMRGGNFGQYDADGRRKKEEGILMKNVLRIKRDVRLLKFFPSECLWEPWFRIYHFFWRMRYY